MEIILTHNNLDFDALASMTAASKIHPEAHMILPYQQSEQVKQYLALYRDSFPFLSEKDVNWEKVRHVILTDVSSLDRTAGAGKWNEHMSLTIYDHHPFDEEDKEENAMYYTENTGAAVTILIEEIMQRQLPITSYESTLFALGLYTDTGSFTFPDTTIRDIKAAVYLMEQGMQLEVVQQFSEETLSASQQNAFKAYLASAETIEKEGLHLTVATLNAEEFIGSLNVLTSRVLETLGSDALITVTSMKNKIFIIGRSTSDRVNILPVMKYFGGGGHERAASATLKEGELTSILHRVKEQLEHTITRAVWAEELMSSPVKTLFENTTIDEAKNQMLYYGHNGFPIVDEQERLIGIISRRDIDKANRHGLGHAPVKGYMSTNPITISLNTTFEEIQQVMIEHNIGRLPVVDKTNIVGIVSRTNVIEHIHQTSKKTKKTDNLQQQMERLLPKEALELLKKVGTLAEERSVKAFMVGGIVRDLILETSNEDIDIVVEGDGIAFAEAFAMTIDGSVHRHDSFGTATVETPDGWKLDFATSRTEYYKQPAALPTVQPSNIKEDLYRRDFTMNALAVALLPESFGDLIDPFHGVDDIKQKRLCVLHNLSFVEDPTRILRGIRFESRFSFHLDEESEAFIRHSAHSISVLSPTRVIAELKQLFSETDPWKSIDRLHKLGVLAHFLPHAVWDTKTASILESLLQSGTASFKNDTWFIIVCCLYAKDANTAYFAENLAATKPQKKLIRDITYLLEQYPCSNLPSPGKLHAKAFHVEDDALLFTEIVFQTGEEKERDCASLFQHYREKRAHLSRWISGEDLKKAGLSPGPAFKEYLFQVEQAALDEKITSREEAMAYVRRFL